MSRRQQSCRQGPRHAVLTLVTIALAAVAASLPPVGASAPDPTRNTGHTVAAPTGLSATGSTRSSISIAWTASSSSKVAGYGVYRGGALVGRTAETQYTLTGLACGTAYVIGVDAVRTSGQRSARTDIVASTRPCPDTSAPTTPTVLVATGSTQTAISLSWIGSIDDVGVVGYGVHRGTTKVADTAATSHTVSGLSCGTTYALAVDAFDAAGNRSAKASLTVATAACADTTPPSVPQSQQITGTTTNSISMSWSPSSDDVGVAGYAVYLDGRHVANTTQTSYTYLGLACGTIYTVGLEAYDAAGNRSDKGYASGPATTQSCVSADTSSPTTPTNLASTGTTQTSISLSWSASSDNTAVAGYGHYRNGVLIDNGTGTTHTHSGLTCGTSYTLAVDAYDAAGNRSARASGTVTTSPCSTSSAPGTVANLWVDTSGGTCVRQATPGGYSDAQACGWNQAYQSAQTGDSIIVRGGSYGNVSVGPNRSAISAPGVTFTPASGESVLVGNFENGHISGGSGASNVTFAGPVTARTFRSDRASNVVVDRWNVDCNGCVGVQTFHVEAAANVTVRNSEISDNTDNSLIWISGSSLTFENNRIHDAGLRSGSGAHTECLYAWNVTNLTLKRNHFYHCAVMDVFITGGSVANGGYIENNVFEKPWSSTGVISNSAYAFHFRNGGDPSPDPNNWDFRHNTFVGPLSVSSENPVGPDGMRVIGNLFLAGAACGKSNTTYSHNAFVSGACGSNSVTHSSSTYASGFTSTGDPGDYSLRSTSVLRDRGNNANHPAVDLRGAARSDGSPDIGAYEYR